MKKNNNISKFLNVLIVTLIMFMILNSPRMVANETTSIESAVSESNNIKEKLETSIESEEQQFSEKDHQNDDGLDGFDTSNDSNSSESESKETIETPMMEESESSEITESLEENATDGIVEENVSESEQKSEEGITEEPKIISEENKEDVIESTEDMEISMFSMIHPTSPTKGVNYVAVIDKGFYSIDSLPWGDLGFKKIGTTAEYVGKMVIVTEQTTNGLYAKIYIEGLGYGWIDCKALKKIEVSDITDYSQYITSNLYSIDSLPWGTPGFKNLDTTKNHLGKLVTITHTTRDGNYFHADGLGWIDKRAFGLYGTTYTGIVKNENLSIDSLPWGTPGFKKISNAGDYNGKILTIKGTIQGGSYLLVYADNQLLGWVDHRAIKSYAIKEVSFDAYVSGKGFSIDSLPWGEPGFKKVGSTTHLYGQKVKVTKATPTETYYLLSQDGVDIGWVDHRAIFTMNTIAVNYSTYVSSAWYSIDSLPWGTPTFTKLDASTTYVGHPVIVTAESQNRAYALISWKGKELGWVDKNALGLSGSSYSGIFINGNYSISNVPVGSIEHTQVSKTNQYLGQEIEVKGTTKDGVYSLVHLNGSYLGWVDSRSITKFTYKTTNINQEIGSTNYSVDSLPWGVQGFKKIGSTVNLVGLNVNITKISNDNNYYFVRSNGKNIGWIDKRAFGLTPASYSFYLTQGHFSIDSLPWGTVGFTRIATTNSYIGKELQVVATTREGTYLKVSYNGNMLGWIDYRSGKRLHEKPYTQVSNLLNGYSIDTLPWGTHGFQRIGLTASYVGKQVTATKQSSDGNYVFITAAGMPSGWVDKKALKQTRTVFIDVGHGGSDPGAQYYGIKEKDINLQVSMKLKSELEAGGYRVIMSRTGDTYMDYKTERSIMANKSGADIFVSVHHNAMPGNSNVNGIETFLYEYEPDYPPKVNQAMHNNPDRLLKSAALANAIHNNLIKDTRAYDRKVKSGSYAVLRETALPAILVELGFMSNQTELNKLTTASYQNTLAKAMKNGIDGYFKTY